MFLYLLIYMFLLLLLYNDMVKSKIYKVAINLMIIGLDAPRRGR